MSVSKHFSNTIFSRLFLFNFSLRPPDYLMLYYVGFLVPNSLQQTACKRTKATDAVHSDCGRNLSSKGHGRVERGSKKETVKVNGAARAGPGETPTERGSCCRTNSLCAIVGLHLVPQSSVKPRPTSWAHRSYNCFTIFDFVLQNFRIRSNSRTYLIRTLILFGYYSSWRISRLHLNTFRNCWHYCLDWFSCRFIYCYI